MCFFAGRSLFVEYGCVCGCSKDESISHFLFPTEGKLCEKWMNFIKTSTNKELDTHPYLQICAKHFVSSDFTEV